MDLPTHLADVASFTGNEMAETAHQYTLEFRWFDRTELEDLDVRPARIRELLAQPLPAGVPTVVNIG